LSRRLRSVGLVKRCCTCHEVKPLDAFNVLRRAVDGRQPRCRECCRAWYVRNREKHVKNVGRRNARVRTELQSLIAEHLRANPCVDCGESDLLCLEFDHRPGGVKLSELARLVNSSRAPAIVLAEIEKCDVRCANCHRRVTARRAGYWRVAVADREAEQQRMRASQRLAALLPATGTG
jgi:hypothetical protein